MLYTHHLPVTPLQGSVGEPLGQLCFCPSPQVPCTWCRLQAAVCTAVLRSICCLCWKPSQHYWSAGNAFLRLDSPIQPALPLSKAIPPTGPCWTGGSRIPAFDSKVQCPHAARLPPSSCAPPVKAPDILGSQEETSLLLVVQSSNLSPSPLALAFSSSMASFFHGASAAGHQPDIETTCSGLCRGLSLGLWRASLPLPLSSAKVCSLSTLFSHEARFG